MSHVSIYKQNEKNLNIIATKRVKYLGINLTEEMEDCLILIKERRHR